MRTTPVSGVGGAPLVSRDASGKVLWQLPTGTEPFAAQGLAIHDSELVVAGQLGAHQLQLLTRTKKTPELTVEASLRIL